MTERQGPEQAPAYHLAVFRDNLLIEMRRITMRQTLRFLSTVLAVLAMTLVPLAAQAEAIRTKRPLALTGELGWNGLSGLGPVLSYHMVSNLSVDAGLGLAATGIKGGFRLRGNLLTSNFTPFAAAGLLYGVGTGEAATSLTTDGNTITYRVKGSPYAQIVAGLEYIDDGGFTFMATLGYAKLLQSSNYVITEGEPTKVQQNALDLALGSGAVVSVAFGYAFQL
jgi:hypothetical protein